jgi:flavin reductase (DIM6/NTAB) family NADH-FMN oxidoreductase RutF
MASRHQPDSGDFRRCCSRFATGITIASVLDAEGQPHGLTVNSFTSVSLEPPLVLICIDYASNVLPMFRAASHFGVNILNAGQQELSARFATRGMDRFDGVPWTAGDTGVPLIPGALAHFECAVRNVVEAGDHAVFLAEAVRVALGEQDVPLVYFDSRYRLLTSDFRLPTSDSCLLSPVSSTFPASASWGGRPA